MFKHYFFLVSFLFLVSHSAIAQIQCGHDYVQKKLAQYPELAQSSEKIYQDAIRHKSFTYRDNEILTIPVVLHVVWKDEEENIPDSLIQQQMAVLNEDYRRLNPDSGQVRDIFLPVVGDARIEFTLHEVIRVETDTLFNVDIFAEALPEYVKESQNGGSDPLSVDSFLNIWVCKIQPIDVFGVPGGQLLGYAYPPMGAPNWPVGTVPSNENFQGVVIDYRAFGRNNPYLLSIPGIIDSVITNGRTTVHEVGHYLGLRHTWGDGNAFGNDGCNVDDGLADTPNAATSSEWECDVNKNTCPDTGAQYPDMFENYMDYSEETCMNSFTRDQIGIMRYILRSHRCELIGDCSAIATEEALHGQDIHLFPNPTTGHLTISLPENGAPTGELELLTLTGQLILNTEFQSTKEIDLNIIPNGIYVAKIIYGDQQIVKKVIKQ